MTRLEQLQKLASVTRDDPMPHYAVGLELAQQERWSEAVQAFQQALRINENYSAALYHMARAQIKAGAHADAVETLRRGMTVAHAAGDWKTEAEMRDLLDTIT